MALDLFVTIELTNSTPVTFTTDKLVVKTKGASNSGTIITVESEHLISIINREHITKIEVRDQNNTQVDGETLKYWPMGGSSSWAYTAHVFISEDSWREGVTFALPEDNIAKN